MPAGRYAWVSGAQLTDAEPLWAAKQARHSDGGARTLSGIKLANLPKNPEDNAMLKEEGEEGPSAPGSRSQRRSPSQTAFQMLAKKAAARTSTPPGWGAQSSRAKKVDPHFRRTGEWVLAAPQTEDGAGILGCRTLIGGRALQARDARACCRDAPQPRGVSGSGSGFEWR